MSIAALVRRLSDAGATPEVIAIAVEALEEAQAKDAERRAKEAARKRRSRSSSAECPRTVTGQSDDSHGTFHGQSRDASADPSRPPGSPRPSPAPQPTPLNPPAHPDDDDCARELAGKVCEIVGLGAERPGLWSGVEEMARRWLAAGCTEADVIAGVTTATAKRKGSGTWPPASPSYFDQPIADAEVARLRPMPAGRSSNGRHQGTVCLVAPSSAEYEGGDERLARMWKAGMRDMPAFRNKVIVDRLVRKGLIDGDQAELKVVSS